MKMVVVLGRGKAALQAKQVGQCDAVKLLLLKQHSDHWLHLAARLMDREIVLVIDGNRTSEANEELASSFVTPYCITSAAPHHLYCIVAFWRIGGI